MPATVIKTRFKSKTDTTANWEIIQTSFIPFDGEVIIYKDYASEEYVTSNGHISTRTIPAMKVGNGQNYLIDLPFLTSGKMSEVIMHMEDSSIHVTPQEKEFWNNKLNCELGETADEDMLILNRE